MSGKNKTERENKFENFCRQVHILTHVHGVKDIRIIWECEWNQQKKKPEIKNYLEIHPVRPLRNLTPQDAVKGAINDSVVLVWPPLPQENPAFSIPTSSASAPPPLPPHLPSPWLDWKGKTLQGKMRGSGKKGLLKKRMQIAMEQSNNTAVAETTILKAASDSKDTLISQDLCVADMSSLVRLSIFTNWAISIVSLFAVSLCSTKHRISCWKVPKCNGGRP